MPVNDTHPEYRQAEPRYKLIRAIINNEAQSYIRTPDINDPARSAQYKEDAILTNFTKLTCEGLTGLVFRKELELQLPAELQYLEKDATGAGINIYQFAQHSVYEVLQTGRYGYLVDYHNSGGKAYIKPYAAETIINWKAAEYNGVVQPWLIVLKEEKILDDDDIFCQESEEQYRVLLLVGGVYSQLIYDKDLQNISTFTPTDFNGNPFPYIPFVFVGSENNDACVDSQPLYDLAILSLGHYRNSADYEESIFICGQPYLWVNVGEASSDDFKTANPSGVDYGSRKVLVLANGGSANLLQANPNQLVAQAMNEKLEQAAKIGARLIEASGGRETAEAAKIRYGSQHSALYTLTSNISWGIGKALEVVCQFMGANIKQVEFKLNDQFYDDMADANLLAQQIMLLDRGVISADDIRAYGRKTGFINDLRTDEEISLDAELGMDILSDYSTRSNPKAPAPVNEAD